LYASAKNRTEPPSCVGGQTKFYGAALYRLRESDFREVKHECGTSPAWPLSYSELEPHYAQAETLYRVHGSPDGDPSEPPRAAPFPHPSITHDPIIAEVVERLERSGTKTSAIPSGLDYGPNGRCMLCATCDAHYCQVDAKMDAEIAALRPALATGRVQLMTRTDCLCVLTTADGSRVTGVVLSYGGAEHTVRAETVAVCAGLRGSALLLRRSQTSRHPNGLGNATGCLGRYMAGHSTGYVFPFISWRRVPAIHSKTFGINTYYDGAPDWPYPMGVIQMAGQVPFWKQASPAIRRIAHLVGRHSLMCFYMTEALPTRETGLIFGDSGIVGCVPPVHNAATFSKLRRLAVEAFRRAGYHVLARARPPYLWHEVGTARLGDNPETSVVDRNCQVHGIHGLYVVDQSVLPSAGAVNTCLTIIALALRAGDHIANQSSDTAQPKPNFVSALSTAKARLTLPGLSVNEA
jgi:choline dehydrogenase-like flavoprotein